MLYKIIMITDNEGNVKTDEGSVRRTNRIVDIDKNKIEFGKPLIMTWNEPQSRKVTITSDVENVVNASDGIIVWTKNSMYFLVEKDKADKE